MRQSLFSPAEGAARDAHLLAELVGTHGSRVVGYALTAAAAALIVAIIALTVALLK